MNRVICRVRFGMCLALAAWLAGCAGVGPDYRAPEPELPGVWRNEAGWSAAQPADHLPRGQWWSVYADATLDALVAQVERANPDVQAALAAFRQARAGAQSARAGFFPQLGASIDLSRNRSAASATRGAAIADSRQIGLDASWEADLWGRIGRSVEAADASVQASAADYGAALLALQAELVQDYFQLRAVDAQRRLYGQSIVAYERALAVTRNRLAAGVDSRAAVAQAEAQWRSAQAQALDLELNRRQLEHAIAVLVGKAPADFALPESTHQTALPSLPPVLPSELLQRRPDIAAAERRMAAANAQIGVARAAWFPSLTFNVSAAYAGTDFSNWFSASSLAWGLGTSLAQTLFDGGRRQAELERSRAAWQASVANYRASVLGALQEVEDNLAALSVLGEELQRREQALAAARESERLVLNQYQAGTLGYLNVVTAQTTALDAARTLEQLRGRRYSASVLLNKALGGGWAAGEMTKSGAQ